MLVVGPLRHQVNRKRRKYSRSESSLQSNSPSLAMFTRAQASAATTSPSAVDKSSSSASNSSFSSSPSSSPSASDITTTEVSQQLSSSGTVHTTSGGAIVFAEPVPNVSLTITAVAASNVSEGIPIITTSCVPALDTPTITNLVLNSLEGVHSGVPTRTTPTLTPTTLRNIEQTFLELSTLPPPENHTNQAGFVPPLVQPNGGSTYVSVDSKCWGGGTLTQLPNTSSVTSLTTSTGALLTRPPSAHSSGSSPPLGMPSQIQQPSRRMGGRRPVKDDRITAEEEERRSLRRERNKLAAARCRKRRLDQTNMLQDETDDLEDKKSGLQHEIQLLQQQRDELEFLLATHKAVCRRRFQNSTGSCTVPSSVAPVMTTAAPTTITSLSSTTTTTIMHQDDMKKPLALPNEDVIVKEEPMEEEFAHKKSFQSISRPRRPTSLAVAPVALRTPSVADLGVPIETPSAGLRGLNFESMMEGGTGLTPVTSSAVGLTPLHTGLTPLTTPVVSAPAVSSSSGNCGSQQRSSSSDLSSPESVPPKLVSL